VSIQEQTRQTNKQKTHPPTHAHTPGANEESADNLTCMFLKEAEVPRENSCWHVENKLHMEKLQTPFKPGTFL